MTCHLKKTISYSSISYDKINRKSDLQIFEKKTSLMLNDWQRFIPEII